MPFEEPEPKLNEADLERIGKEAYNATIGAANIGHPSPWLQGVNTANMTIEQQAKLAESIAKARAKQDFENYYRSYLQRKAGYEFEQNRPNLYKQLREQGLSHWEALDKIDRLEYDATHGPGSYAIVAERNSQVITPNNPNAIINESDREKALAKQQAQQQTTTQVKDMSYLKTGMTPDKWGETLKAGAIKLMATGTPEQKQFAGKYLENQRNLEAQTKAMIEAQQSAGKVKVWEATYIPQEKQDKLYAIAETMDKVTFLMSKGVNEPTARAMIAKGMIDLAEFKEWKNLQEKMAKSRKGGGTYSYQLAQGIRDINAGNVNSGISKVRFIVGDTNFFNILGKQITNESNGQHTYELDIRHELLELDIEDANRAIASAVGGGVILRPKSLEEMKDNEMITVQREKMVGGLTAGLPMILPIDEVMTKKEYMQLLEKQKKQEEENLKKEYEFAEKYPYGYSYITNDGGVGVASLKLEEPQDGVGVDSLKLKEKKSVMIMTLPGSRNIIDKILGKNSETFVTIRDPEHETSKMMRIKEETTISRGANVFYRLLGYTPDQAYQISDAFRPYVTHGVDFSKAENRYYLPPEITEREFDKKYKEYAIGEAQARGDDIISNAIGFGKDIVVGTGMWAQKTAENIRQGIAIQPAVTHAFAYESDERFNLVAPQAEAGVWSAVKEPFIFLAFSVLGPATKVGGGRVGEIIGSQTGNSVKWSVAGSKAAEVGSGLLFSAMVGSEASKTYTKEGKEYQDPLRYALGAALPYIAVASYKRIETGQWLGTGVRELEYAPNKKVKWLEIYDRPIITKTEEGYSFGSKAKISETPLSLLSDKKGEVKFLSEGLPSEYKIKRGIYEDYIKRTETPERQMEIFKSIEHSENLALGEPIKIEVLGRNIKTPFRTGGALEYVGEPKMTLEEMIKNKELTNEEKHVIINWYRKNRGFLNTYGGSVQDIYGLKPKGSKRSADFDIIAIRSLLYELRKGKHTGEALIDELVVDLRRNVKGVEYITDKNTPGLLIRKVKGKSQNLIDLHSKGLDEVNDPTSGSGNFLFGRKYEPIFVETKSTGGYSISTTGTEMTQNIMATTAMLRGGLGTALHRAKDLAKMPYIAEGTYGKDYKKKETKIIEKFLYSEPKTKARALEYIKENRYPEKSWLRDIEKSTKSSILEASKKLNNNISSVLGIPSKSKSAGLSKSYITSASPSVSKSKSGYSSISSYISSNKYSSKSYETSASRYRSYSKSSYGSSSRSASGSSKYSSKLYSPSSSSYKSYSTYSSSTTTDILKKPPAIPEIKPVGGVGVVIGGLIGSGKGKNVQRKYTPDLVASILGVKKTGGDMLSALTGIGIRPINTKKRK